MTEHPTFKDELAFEKYVVALATHLGWFSMRVHKSTTRGRVITPTTVTGFGRKVTAWPDRTFWSKRGGLLVVEFKLDDGDFRKDQAEVLESLEAAGVNVAVWRPANLETLIMPTLAHRPSHQPQGQQ